MLKSELRPIYLKKQRTLSEAERKRRSRRIAEQFFDAFELKNIRFLHVFLPIEKNGEIETAFICKRLWKNFPALAVIAPRVDFQTMTLEHRRLTVDSKIVENKWRIPEPADGKSVRAEEIDAVLTPLLCFDERGFRVGYGKGFYDKFLSECRADCLKIGLSYFPPIAEIANARSFDVKLDFCITPEAISSWQ